VAIALAIPLPGAAQIASEIVVSGLTHPVAVVADPLDAATLFIVEQRGLVRVVRDGRLLDAPFLDLREAVTSGGERGLLGMAVAPNASNGAAGGRVFVNFTDRIGNTVVARFARVAGNPLVADSSSRFDLFWPDGRRSIEQPFANHNGGHLLFGPDGYLYIGLGDGGSGGDPMHRAQDPSSLLGKMLRIDVAVADDDPRGYRVPDDNPFVDGVPIFALGEIWAFGLRNPWRYSFDPPERGGTGALLIGDVGQNAREEVNLQPAGSSGLNFGWRLYEGRSAFDGRRPAAYEPLSEPIHDYAHSEGQCVTGGLVYRGAALDPSLRGRYFFADFAMGRVFSLTFDASGTSGASDVREHTATLGGGGRLGNVSSFGLDHDGELYLLNHSAGTLLKIVPDTSLVPSAPEGARATADDQGVLVAWNRPTAGATPTSYLVETTPVAGMRTLRTLDAGERLDLHLAFENDEACVRVRAVGRDGVGPASTPVCLP
jgi:glucose/arabinose dehydrogenase